MAKLTARSTVRRLALLNAVIAGAGAAAGAALAAGPAARTSPVAVAMLIGATAAAMVAADYLVLRGTFAPLAELSRALTSLHKGERAWSLPPGGPEPAGRDLSRAVSDMLARIDVESRMYSSKIFESIEEERRRIGRELHDDTTQSLAAALISLDVAAKGMAGCPATVHAQVARAEDLIRYCLGQLKLLVHDLRPSMLDDFGLAPTLRWYVQSHLDQDGLVVDADLEGTQARLPPDVETALYRIAQESLANVQKHSGATRVQLRLETQPGYASLLVADNGRGFDPQEVMLDHEGRYGVGLLSVRERAELLHGSVSIASRPGEGTRVHVVIPLKEEP
jgi:two-component system sensor histidine kinase UhpB